MLLAGLIVRNSGLYNIYEDLGLATISKIRTFCLTFIMIRAGLQLSITNLRKYSTFLMILAFIPSTVEVLVLALCCNTMLGYPWNWSFMTGTILACLSPVITFNCIIALAERGYGEDKDLASIICTAVCIDGILIVALFGLCYSFVFGNDWHGSSSVKQLFSEPLRFLLATNGSFPGGGRIEFWFYVRVVLRDFVLSIVAGVVLGVCFIFFPHRSHARSVATYFTTYWTPFTVKERLFVVVSWLPKGTLQAALGPLAYEHVQNKPDVEKVQLALDVVRISVITILFLAPIGAFVITFSGPILLNQINVEEHPMNPKLNYLRRLSLQPPQESQRSKIIVPEQV
nr:sodium/hydrogen exchanger 9B1-like [Nomia melanderi]